MARNYNYLLTILKTPMGYLTKSGFTQDINSDEIVVLKGYTFGRLSSITTRVQFFLEKTNISKEISKELYDRSFECEVIAFECKCNIDCKTCKYYLGECKFWSKSREQLKLFKLYY